jgi:hypothetical protein
MSSDAPRRTQKASGAELHAKWDPTSAWLTTLLRDSDMEWAGLNQAAAPSPSRSRSTSSDNGSRMTPTAISLRSSEPSTATTWDWR